MKTAFAVLAAAALGFSAAAAAQEGTLKKIKDSGSITIGHRDASLPFSYYDDKQQPIGYAMDLCHRIVDAVKTELKMPKLETKYQLVTSANRIPLMANGTIDLECGSTTNNLARQKEVSFTITHFVTANRWVAKKSAKLDKLASLKGKTIVSTAGTYEPQGGGTCLIQSPSAVGRNSGKTKNQRNICTMSGMLRKISTYRLPTRTAQRMVVVRTVPTKAPTSSAMTHAARAVARVQPSPTIR